MLCAVFPKEKRPGTVPVYLNVYDLAQINSYAYWVGLGIYHSGVQVHGIEYAFGAHENPTTGVFEVEPKQCPGPGYTFRKSILIGRTDMGSEDVQNFMAKISKDYAGNTYNLITKNCNHFCNDVCIRLTGKCIPRWVNRLARFGLFCNCVLPADINETKVGRVIIEGNSATEASKKRVGNQSSVRELHSFMRQPHYSRTERAAENTCLPIPTKTPKRESYLTEPS